MDWTESRTNLTFQKSFCAALDITHHTQLIRFDWLCDSWIWGIWQLVNNCWADPHESFPQSRRPKILVVHFTNNSFHGKKLPVYWFWCYKNNGDNMDHATVKASKPALLSLLNSSSRSSASLQSIPASRSFMPPGTMSIDNNALHQILSEALAISEEIEGLLMTERGQELQSRNFTENDSHFQNDSACSKQ